MGFFRNDKKVNMELEAAYKMVYEDLCSSENHLFQGIFDPNEKDEEYMNGIGYVINHIGIKAYKSDLTVVPKRFFGFTNNIMRSCIKKGILPRHKINDEEKELLISRLRAADDKALNFFADEYEQNRVVVKMCSSETMNDIAAGKTVYPLVEEAE